MTNRTRPAALAVCALLALTGCGGSSGAGAKASTAPTPLTAAQAKTAAAAAILVAGDLPGYKVAAQTVDADQTKTQAELKTCLGITDTAYLASDPGRSFTKGDLEVDSSADVARTQALAKAELAAYTGPKSNQCTKAQLVKLIATQSAGVGALTSFSQTPVVVTVPGSDAAFGYELSVDAAGGGQTLQLRGYELGALVGQVEVDISVIGNPTANLTLDEAQALLVTSVARVKATL